MGTNVVPHSVFSACAVNLPVGEVLETQGVVLINATVAFKNQRTVRLHKGRGFINGETN